MGNGAFDIGHWVQPVVSSLTPLSPSSPIPYCLLPIAYLLECDFSGMTTLVWADLPFLPLVWALPLRG